MIEKLSKWTKQSKTELYYIIAFILSLVFLYISTIINI